MTIATETTLNVYTGNNNASTYSYGFKIFTDSELIVTRANTEGVETVLTLAIDYSVSGAGDDGGGSITLLTSSGGTGFNLAEGYKLAISRDIPLLQSLNLTNHGPYNAADQEVNFDKLVLMIQQLKEEISRCPKLKITSGDVGEALTGTIADMIADEVTAKIDELNLSLIPVALTGHAGETLRVNDAEDGYELTSGIEII
jgi:hypothetical protein